LTEEALPSVHDNITAVRDQCHVGIKYFPFSRLKGGCLGM